MNSSTMISNQPRGQCTLSQLTIEVIETAQSSQASHIIQIQNQQAITDSVKEFKDAATSTNNLFKLQLTINGRQAQLLFTIDLPTTADDTSLSALSASNDNSEQDSGLSSAPIEAHVKQALKDYHSLNRLSKNPLAKLLNLDSYRLPDDNPLTASGIALRRHLDQVLDAISGLQPGESINLDKVRLEHYLALRYRDNISHSDLALYMGYTERHLRRLQNELILEATDLMVHPVTRTMSAF